MQDVALRLIEVVLSRPLDCFKPAALLSWLATLLLDPQTAFSAPKGGPLAADAARHAAVAAAVCRRLHAFGPLPQLLAMLAPSLARPQAAGSGSQPAVAAAARFSRRDCCGVLQLVLTVVEAAAHDQPLAALLPEVLRGDVPPMVATLLLGNATEDAGSVGQLPAGAAAGAGVEPSPSGRSAVGGAIVLSGAADSSQLGPKRAGVSADEAMCHRLLAARPDELLAPTLQALAGACGAALEAAPSSGSSAEAQAVVTVAIKATGVLLSHPPLQAAVVSKEEAVAAVLAAMRQHGTALHRLTGNGAALHGCEQLAATLELLCGHGLASKAGGASA